MDRSQLRIVVTVKDPATSELILVENAAGFIRRAGTMDAPVMYVSETAGTPLANPQYSDNQGEIVVWLDPTEDPFVVDVYVTSNGGAAFRAGLPSQLIPFDSFTEKVQGRGGGGLVEIDSTGLNSAQIDALWVVQPANGTIVSDPTNHKLLIRQGGSWYHSAVLTAV